MKDIKKITLFCSELRKLFRYPYFFNWSHPTNHSESGDTENIDEITYAEFRVGKYALKQEVESGYVTDRLIPVERAVVFGPIFGIVDQFIALNWLLVHPGENGPIESWADVETHLDDLKKAIDEHLKPVMVVGSAVVFDTYVIATTYPNGCFKCAENVVECCRRAMYPSVEEAFAVRNTLNDQTKGRPYHVFHIQAPACQVHRVDEVPLPDEENSSS